MLKKITGSMFYYYFICHRKLWSFYNEITMEDTNENVLLGKLIDENSYSRESKHIMIDETVNVDFIKDWKVLHEIKKSKSIEEAAIWQLKYYLYFLDERGINVEKGILDYPTLRKREEVKLDSGDKEKIKNILIEIEKITLQDKMPQVINQKICKSCSYYEYCYI